METIALFGVTGKTGSVLVKKLLEKNYKVKALVRNPDKVTLSSSNLSIIKGDVLNAAHVRDCIIGCDAVINVIGHVKGCPPNLQTVASNHIIKAMGEAKIQRLINLTGGGVTVKGDNPGLVDKLVVFIMKNLAGKAMAIRLKDGDEHVKLISKTNLEWTIVRAPVILPKPAKGKTRVGLVGHIPGFSVTFEDLSNEIVNILENKLYIRQYPYVTNG